MKTKEQEIFRPFVTVEEAVAFRSDKPETWTRSEIMNAFCRTLEKLGPAVPGKAVAEYMGLNYIKLSGAIEIICGQSLQSLRVAILEAKLHALREQHPYWTTDKLAKHAGLYDRSSMRRILGSAAYKRLAAPRISEEKRRLIKEFEEFIEKQK